MKEQQQDFSVEELLSASEWLKNLARHLVKDEQLAEDMVQETYLSALREPPPSRGSLKGWLATVLRRRAHKQQRSSTSRIARESSFASQTAIDSHKSVGDRFAMQKMVVDEVARLKEPLREVLLLHYFEGLDAGEISKRKGIPPATVRVRLHRAHTQLRERLDTEHEGRRSAWAIPLASFAALRPSGSELSLNEFGNLVQKIGRNWMTTKTMMMAAGAICVAIFSYVGPKLIDADEANTENSIKNTEVVRAARTKPGVRGLDAQGEQSSSEKNQQGFPNPRENSPKPPSKKVAQSRSGSIELTVKWSDGLPVKNTQVRLVRWEESNAILLANQRVYTDDVGHVNLKDLAPGPLTLYCLPYGSHLQHQVKDSSSVKLKLIVDVGLMVSGQVLDGKGKPVKRAAVWLRNTASEGQVVAHTNDEGRFHLRGVEKTSVPELAAMAPGYAPSPMKSLSKISAERKGKLDGEEITVEFVLHERGSSIRGMVVDEDENPIPGAIVEVQSIRIGHPNVPQRLIANKSGEFFFTSVANGKNHLRVAARGFAPAIVTRDVKEPLQTVITLGRGAQVRGTLRNQRGHPIEGASVFTGMLWEFDYNNAITKADGRFLLEDVMPGARKFWAQKTRSGRTETTLALAIDSDITWNPVLDIGLVLSGTVLQEDGSPLVNARVYARDKKDRGGKSRFNGFCKTNAKGQFSISNCPAKDLTVTVFDWQEKKFVTVRTKVRPGVSPLSLRVGGAGFAGVKGRLIGSPEVLKNFAIRIRGTNHRTIKVDPETGSFRVDDILPCSCDFGLLGPESMLKLGRHILHRGQTLDLGDIKVSPHLLKNK